MDFAFVYHAAKPRDVPRLITCFISYLSALPQTLQRASSVPARSTVPDKTKTFQHPRHEQTQSQDQDASQESASIERPMTPSTTEESVAPNSMEPLLNIQKVNMRSNIKFEINGQHTIPNLPGIIPLQGHLHQQGWL